MYVGATSQHRCFKEVPIIQNPAVIDRVRSILPICGLIIFLVSCNRIPTAEETSDLVLMLTQHRNWAWILGVLLIWVDLVLPVPQTAIIAALGIIYGTLLGGLIGALALVTGGLLGYALMQTSVRRLLSRFVGERSVGRFEILFAGGGAWAIVLTRSLPFSIPEAMVFLAGVARMPIGKFAAALVVGSIPTGFVFAAIGEGWSNEPVLALAVSYVMPILILPVALYVLRRNRT